MRTKLMLWVVLSVMFSAYFYLAWMFPFVYLWSMIPTYLMAVPNTTVYQHRCMTHSALKMPKWMRHAWELVQFLTVGDKTREWVALHREHHAKSDKEGDPHSPWVDGLIPAILPFNVVKYRIWLNENGHRVPELAHDVIAMETPTIRWMYRHTFLGLGIGTLLLCLAMRSWFGLLAAGFHVVTFVFILMPLINGLCHWPHKWLGGYQNGQAGHAITTFNNWFVALLTGGEGFHNDHHLQQRTAVLAWKWWKIPADWGYWMFILPFELLGIVNDVRHPKIQPSSAATV